MLCTMLIADLLPLCHSRHRQQGLSIGSPLSPVLFFTHPAFASYDTVASYIAIDAERTLALSNLDVILRNLLQKGV